MTSVRQPAPGRPYDALYGTFTSSTSRDHPQTPPRTPPRTPGISLTIIQPSKRTHADPVYTVSGSRDHHRNVHGNPAVEKVQHFDNMYSEVKSFPNHTMR